MARDASSPTRRGRRTSSLGRCRSIRWRSVPVGNVEVNRIAERARHRACPAPTRSRPASRVLGIGVLLDHVRFAVGTRSARSAKVSVLADDRPHTDRLPRLDGRFTR